MKKAVASAAGVLSVLLALGALVAKEQDLQEVLGTRIAKLVDGEEVRSRDELAVLDIVKARFGGIDPLALRSFFEKTEKVDGNEILTPTSEEIDLINIIRKEQTGQPKQQIEEDWKVLRLVAGNPGDFLADSDLGKAARSAIEEPVTPERLTMLLRSNQSAARSEEHDWPPIIRLREADGFFFETGRAKLAGDFERRLKQEVTPELLQRAEKFQVDVIEVVGHTDERPLTTRTSNIDKKVLDVLLRGASVAGLVPGDNAGLGLARAAAVAQILMRDDRLKRYRILPMSGAHLIAAGDQLTKGVGEGDVKERRRIEIRLRRSE